MIFYAIRGGAKLKHKFGFYLFFSSSTGASVEFLYPAILFMNSLYPMKTQPGTPGSFSFWFLMYIIDHFFDPAPVDKTNKTPMCILSVF